MYEVRGAVMNDNTVCCQNRELTEPAGETAVPYGVVGRLFVGAIHESPV